MIRKLFRTLLALLIVVSSFSGTSSHVVHAEENEEIPYSEDPIDIITELGNSYDVFPQTKPRMMLMSGESTTIGDRMGMIYIDNQFGYDYLSYLYVGGKTVFCIEPMMLFSEGVEYTENYTKWDDLSESQRQAIWEINYYGYSYPGHQTDAYYIATQLMIWEVVDQWYDPYYPDGTTYYDVSAEINEINSLRSNPQGRPSFNNTTIKTGLNMPKTITDTKGVLGNYNIHSGNGVELSANGNDLTVTLTSEDFDKSLTFSNKYEARDVNIIYGAPGYQNTIYLATRLDPTGSFKLNFEMLYADIEVEKKDKETGTETQGDATFSGAEFAIKDDAGTLLETITTDGSVATSKKYPLGKTLYVAETKNPEGYLLNDSPVTVNMKEEKDRFTVVVEDQVVKGQIEIAKTVDQKRAYPTESVISVPGVNFVFDIYLKSSGELVETLTTDENGRAMSKLLPYGTYEVKERPVEGYDTLDPFEVKIDEDQKVYFYNIFNDKFRAEVNIYKTDAETGKQIPAAGVEFKIKDEEGNFLTYTVTYPTKYDTDVFVTDETGSVHLPSPLDYGKYWITEIKAPYGYVLSADEIPLNIDGKATEIFMPFENKAQKGQIVVEKYGEMLSGAGVVDSDYGDLYEAIYEEKYLDGVTFEVTAAEDIVGEEGTKWYSKGDVVDTIITNSTGTAKSKELPLGSYIVKETETKPGFVLDEEEHEVTLEYAGQEVEVTSEQITVTNKRQKLDLQVTKLFEEDDPEAYKDVLFGIYAAEDITLGEEVIIPADSLMGLTGIDENGKNNVQFDLPVGNYYLKELKTNVGFVLDEEPHPFTFEYDEDTTKETVTVTMDGIINEKRRLELEVNKVDKDNHDVFLNSAVFEVKDKTTGEDLGILVSGKLALKGDAADEEYEIASDEEFTNIVKTAKTDDKKELILDMPEGTYYARKKVEKAEPVVSEDPVILETTEANEEEPVVEQEVMKLIVRDGKAVLANAIYGHEYEFKEIEAPKSYQLSDALYSYKAVSPEGKDIVVYIFENKRIEVPNTGINW